MKVVAPGSEDPSLSLPGIFKAGKKWKLFVFFCGGLWGGVRLIGAFSKNILELLLLSDFLMIWF